LSVGVAQAFAARASSSTELSDRQVKKLMRAAVYLMNQHQQRLNKPAPAVKRKGKVRYTGASAPGEYPRKRTGFLQANVWMEPLDPYQIAQEGSVRVGLRANAVYGAILEVRYKRLGLKRTLQDLVPQLRAIAGANLRYSISDSLLP